MLPSYETVSHFFAMLAYVLIVCIFSDIALVYLISKYKPYSKNAYFRFHARHGFIRIAAMKVIVGIYLCYVLLHPPINGGALAALILAYCLIIMQLLFDLVKKDNRES